MAVTNAKIPGLREDVAATFLRSFGPAPWTLVAAGRRRQLTAGTVSDGLRRWASGFQAQQANIGLELPVIEGRQWYLAATAPAGASTAELEFSPTHVISGAATFLLWKLLNPLETKAARVEEGRLAAKIKGAALIQGGIIPLPGTIDFVRRGLRIVARHQVRALEPLARSYAVRDGRLAKHSTVGSSAGGQDEAAPLIQRADAIRAAPEDWLWPNVIPTGALTLLSGQPKEGKTTIGLDVAARVSSGTAWPCGAAGAPGRVIVCEVEDSAQSATIPRLKAAGANLARIAVRGREEGPIDLAAHMDALAGEAKRLGDVRLLLLSPLLAFFGTTVHDDTAMRAKLRPLLAWAAQNRVAVLGITHPPKSTRKSLDGWFAGAETYRRAARAAWVVMADPTDKNPIVKRKRRVMICAGINGASDDMRMLYRIEGAKAGGIETSKIVWFPKAEE